jgi:DNA-binding MarR family transcriptional regulator
MAKLGLLTNYALVLLHVGEHPNSTHQEIASAVGITPRATQSNLRALEEDGLISRRKEGRGLCYRVDVRAVLDHQTSAPYTVEQLTTQLSTLIRELQRARRRARSSQT